MLVNLFMIFKSTVELIETINTSYEHELVTTQLLLIRGLIKCFIVSGRSFSNVVFVVNVFVSPPLNYFEIVKTYRF